MKPDDDLPWDALYRRALSAGISDGVFWAISPAALLRLTQKRAPRRKEGRGLTESIL